MEQCSNAQKDADGMETFVDPDQAALGQQYLLRPVIPVVSVFTVP